MLEGAGGNITALIGQSGTFLVDDDFSEMAPKLVAKLKELKGSSPRYILNTHFHYDHTGANEVFSSEAIIMAATEVRTRLSSEQKLWNKIHQAFQEKDLPALTFGHSLTLNFDDETIKMVHLPHGHTDGDSVAFFKKNKVVSMGDLYFSGMYPIFHPEHEGSLKGDIENVKWVISQIRDDWKVIPGHGPLSSKSELVFYSQMIEESILTVQRGLKSNLSLEQIQKTGLNQKWEKFSHGYRDTNQWLASIYKSLTTSK